MPTYQYRCTQCDSDLEAVQAFTDDPLTTCPECSGALRKVFSAAGVVFKGSGFYRTDSRASSSAASNSGSSNSGSSNSGSSNSGSGNSSSSASSSSTSGSSTSGSSGGSGD